MDELARVTEKLAAIADPSTLLGSLFTYAPVAFEVYDADGYCLVTNRAATELFGSTPPPGYNIFEDNLAEAAGMRELIRRAFEGETVRLPPGWYDASQLTNVDVEGKRVAIELTLFPLRDATGAVRHVGLCHKDVTSEMELRNVEASLREAQESMSALLASMGDGMVATDTNGCVTRMNPVGEQLTGWSMAEALGRPIEEVLALAASDGGEAHNPVREVLNHGGSVELPQEASLRARDGSVRSISHSAAPIRGSDGQLLGVVLVLRDVTERVRAQRAMRRAQDEVVRLEAEAREMAEASRMKSDFLASMSHELRTPLNAIIGFAELIEDGLVRPDSPRYKEFVGHILRSGRQLLTLIDDVLDLAKIEAGRLALRAERVVLKEVVDDVCASVTTSGLNAGIMLSTEFADERLDAVLDVARFKQVLFNYLSNALKFTPQGGHVVVRLRGEGDDFLHLEVQDDGPGIPLEDQAILFLDYHPVGARGGVKPRGAGLGLALTKRLVEAQGGRVGVTSAEGKGSIFYCVLPRRPGLQLAASDAGDASDDARARRGVDR